MPNRPQHPRPVRRPKLPRFRQRGIALLTTLVILMLVVSIAAVVLTRQSYAIRQTSDYQDVEQAWADAQSVEQQTIAWMQGDFGKLPYSNLDEDTLTNFQQTIQQAWSGSDTPKVTLENLRLDDLQARYNLNNLVDAQGKLPPSGEDKVVTALAQAAGLPTSFTSVIIDWIDPNSTPLNADGAESDFYAPNGYRAADAYLTDPSELRLLRLEMEPDKKEAALQAFQQTISTLPPATALTTVNANTAGTAVLSAVGVPADKITLITDAQQAKKPFKTKSELSSTLGLDATTNKAVTDRLDVTSQYFRLSGAIKLGRATVFLNSILFHQPQQPVRVIMHQFTRTTEPDTASHVSNTPANPE